MDSTPDSLLVRLRQPGDAEAWDRFVLLFTPLLDRWARSLGVPESDVADLLQDVFLTLVKRLPRFEYDPARSFRGWLRAVLQHAWIDRRQKRVASPLPTGLLQEWPDDGLVTEFDEAEYRRYLVDRAVQILQRDFQPATWKAFWAHVVERRDVGDIARELGVTANAVYLARVRVLTRLRQELAGLYP